MRSGKRIVLIVAVLIACVGCDQTTKSAAKSYLPETTTWSYLGDTIRLRVVHNEGGFLSLGASLPPAWRQWIFLIGAAAALLALCAYVLFSRSVSTAEVIGFALLFAGGAGNLVDRALHDGKVVDFINLGIGPLRTGVFNVADVAVTAAAVVLLASTLRRRTNSAP